MAVDSIQAVSTFRGPRDFPDQTTLFNGPTASKNDRNTADKTEEKKRIQERADRKEPQHAPEGSFGDVEEIRKALDLLNVHLAFSVDQDTGETVIQIVDNKSGEVIRQIPPEERLRLMMHIKERLGNEKDTDIGAEERRVGPSGLLVDKKA